MNPSPAVIQGKLAPRNAMPANRGAHESFVGEVLYDAVLDARDMCAMNFARDEHQRLEKILLTLVIPALGGYDNELASDIARHLEQIATFSGNFCWRHRHLGASYGVVGKRPGIDVEAGL